jgi:hypothetical protein
MVGLGWCFEFGPANFVIRPLVNRGTEKTGDLFPISDGSYA